jgi:hypothetical protein
MVYETRNHSELQNCHTTDKLEATALCKKMLVILVNKVVDKTRIIGNK